uniref:Protein arginine methyltransferase 9 n=1 Tax=Astyanax mexicanus TaxID=7994 RepID=A0A8B9GXJ6_ASTMX
MIFKRFKPKREAPREATREDPARNELISRSLESAQQCLLQQDYGTAFVHYLLVLNLAPVLKDFARVSRLHKVLLLPYCTSLLVHQWQTYWKSSPLLVCILYFRMGFRDEAAAHFHKALKLRPDFPEAKENFYRVANWLVERWHFLMLNDHGRNRKYQLAIQRAVQEGFSTVLDIGTGTGILGMCAKKAGASEVYACELSKTMYELGCEVVSANNMADSIKILHMKSLEMEIPKDIPKRVSLVVTETVDAGLLGEGIIESLIHAWKNLLLPPPNPEEPLSTPSQTGRVIPAGATVFGMAVECQEIRRHHRLCVPALGGLDLEAVGEIRSPVSCSVDADESAEPYTTERLSRLPGGFTALTEPCRVLDIDFNNVQVHTPTFSTTAVILHVIEQWYLRNRTKVGLLVNSTVTGNICSKLCQTEVHSFRHVASQETQDPEVCCSEPLYVLDVSEGFSVLSLMAARLGQDSGTVLRAYSSVEKEQHQALLQLLGQSNGVEESAVEFWLSQVDDESALLQRPASEKLWSAIMLDCIETCGLIRQRLMEKATLARCLLEDGGRIFPERIIIHGLLVEADTLLQESAVQGTDPTLGFNIAPFINQFTFSSLSHLWQVRVSASGRVTAIPFWYQIYLDADLTVSTFSQDSHWKQAAVVLQCPLVVNAGDWVRLTVQLHKSSISITAVGEEGEEAWWRTEVQYGTIWGI